MKWISHFLLLAALESYASLRNTVLKSTHCNRDTSHHVQSSISLMVTLPISSYHDVTWMARRIKGISTTSLNVKKSLDTDNSDENIEKVTYVNEVELRAFWSKSGMSAASYDEGAALMLLSDQDDDNDNDDDDDDDGIKEEVDDVPTTVDRQRLLRKKPSGSTSVIHQIAEKPTVTAIDKKKLLKKFMTKRKAESTDEKIAEATVTLDSSGVPIPAGRSVGIDLGTTNSAISVIEGGKPVIIPCNGARIVPSIVGYDRMGRVIIGEKARRQYVANPKNTFSSVKRIIGRSIAELAKSGEKLSTHKIDKKYLNKKISADEIGMNCPNLERNTTPLEISSEILKHLVAEASAYLGGEVITKAVITVPAYFLPAQCDATIKAGEAAGLLRIKLLREPEAAALAYGLTQRNRQIVLVFDLGGGTFDVSVLEVGDGFVEVIATSGDAHLGGDDFDALIVDWMVEQYALTHSKEESQSLLSNPMIYSRLFEAAEAAKFTLSSESEATISIPFLLGDNSLQCVLPRRKFEQFSKKLLTRLLKPLREVAIMAGVNLPGESGQLGINEDLFFSGDDVENKGVVDLRRNDGLSRQDSSSSSSNSNSNSISKSNKKRSKSVVDDEEEQEQEEGELGNIITEEKNRIDEAYRIGTTVSSSSPPLLSVADLKKQQLGGRSNAKEMKKVKGSTTKELRRLQKEMKDSSLAAFPGGQALDDVILVGGSTRIPAVQRLVKIITGVDPRRTVNPDEAVSLGAAVMAGILDGDITDMQVMSAWQAAMYRAFYEDYRKTDSPLKK